MNDRQHKRAIGVFTDAQTTEDALKELQSSGFPMKQVSVIGKDADPNKQVADAEVRDRVGDTKVEAATSVVANTASAGAMGTVLLGLTSLAIPGVGPIVAAGSLATALVATVTAQGAGAIAANQVTQALSDMGIPEERATVYGEHLQQNNYLVFLEGTPDEVEQAEATLSQRNIQEWGVYPLQQA